MKFIDMSKNINVFFHACCYECISKRNPIYMKYKLKYNITTDTNIIYKPIEMIIDYYGKYIYNDQRQTIVKVKNGCSMFCLTGSLDLSSVYF